MDFLPQIITVAGIHFLAVISPGPDFIMVTKNALVHSRRSGIFTSLGLGAGILTHVTYCLAGIGLIISQSVLLFNTIKLLGAAYLVYIGAKALLSKGQARELAFKPQADLSAGRSFRTGFITNVTNPKATLFILSLFTLVISPTTPFFVKIIMGLEMTIVTALWFCLISYVISHRLVKERFARIQHPLERVMGGLLVLLGLKVALTHSK